jgi:acyl carrier protein
MSEAPDYAGMIGFLTSKILRNAKTAIEPDTPLVSSGVLDSFALIEVVHELEKITARKIPASKVAPRDLNTVRQMFATAERVGTPR